ncbi:hypothetical protein OXX79_008508 [Metschnikowia pulcherrima]
MSSEPMDTSAKAWFRKKLSVVEDDALMKLLSVKQLYNLSNDDVYVKWESFVVTQEDGELDPSAQNVEKFQQHLSEAISAANKKTPALKKVRDLNQKRKIDFSSSPGVTLPSTPQLKKQRPVLTSEPDSSPTRGGIPSSPSKLDTDSNTIVETLNPHVEVADLAKSVHLGAHFNPKKYGFRTLFMDLLESADVLDEQIDHVSQQIQDQYKDTEVSLSNPCMSSQFDIICCGRVVPDTPYYDPSHQQGLNDKSLFLETSRFGGIAQRIPMDVSNLEEYSFFPGQIVALKGSNPTGRTFVVHEVLPLPALGTPVSSIEDIQRDQIPGQGSKIFIAAGPFSNQHSLNYDKLAALVHSLNTHIRPQVAVFFGPFLDLTNHAVENGDVVLEGLPQAQQPKNLDELFQTKIKPILEQIDPKIKVVIFPSLKEAISKHMSYPQKSLDRKELGLPKNFKCYPNPCSFSVNEAMFGASNLDIFKDLKDVFKPCMSGEGKLSTNRFDRIATHIFQQKRYYPIFPGSIKKTSMSRQEAEKMAILRDGVAGEDLADVAIGGSRLELPYSGLAELELSLTDVLLIPSEMKYFAKVVNGVVVINPGQFIRPGRDASREDGSYVVLSIKPADETDPDNIEKVEGADTYYHNIYKRCRVDIYKS